jgi:prophage antirepressor-like protein
MIPQQFQITGNDATGQFVFSNYPVRFILKDDEPWFVVPDCGTALNVKKARQMVENFPEDEKGTAMIKDALGRLRETLVVSFPGLLRLIFQSRKSDAEAFKRYVYHEVLPAIQKTGKFETERYLPIPDPEPTRELTVEDEVKDQMRRAREAKEAYNLAARAVMAHRRAVQETNEEQARLEAAEARALETYNAHRTIVQATLHPYLEAAKAMTPPPGERNLDDWRMAKALQMAGTQMVTRVSSLQLAG